MNKKRESARKNLRKLSVYFIMGILLFEIVFSSYASASSYSGVVPYDNNYQYSGEQYNSYGNIKSYQDQYGNIVYSNEGSNDFVSVQPVDPSTNSPSDTPNNGYSVDSESGQVTQDGSNDKNTLVSSSDVKNEVSGFEWLNVLDKQMGDGAAEYVFRNNPELFEAYINQYAHDTGLAPNPALAYGEIYQSILENSNDAQLAAAIEEDPEFYLNMLEQQQSNIDLPSAKVDDILNAVIDSGAMSDEDLLSLVKDNPQLAAQLISSRGLSDSNGDATAMVVRDPNQFVTYDENGNAVPYRTVGEAKSDQIKSIDPNGDGKISMDEIKSIQSKKYDELYNKLDSMDKSSPEYLKALSDLSKIQLNLHLLETSIGLNEKIDSFNQLNFFTNERGDIKRNIDSYNDLSSYYQNQINDIITLQNGGSVSRRSSGNTPSSSVPYSARLCAILYNSGNGPGCNYQKYIDHYSAQLQKVNRNLAYQNMRMFQVTQDTNYYQYANAYLDTAARGLNDLRSNPNIDPSFYVSVQNDYARTKLNRAISEAQYLSAVNSKPLFWDVMSEKDQLAFIKQKEKDQEKVKQIALDADLEFGKSYAHLLDNTFKISPKEFKGNMIDILRNRALLHEMIQDDKGAQALLDQARIFDPDNYQLYMQNQDHFEEMLDQAKNQYESSVSQYGSNLENSERANRATLQIGTYSDKLSTLENLANFGVDFLDFNAVVAFRQAYSDYVLPGVEYWSGSEYDYSAKPYYETLHEILGQLKSQNSLFDQGVDNIKLLSRKNIDGGDPLSREEIYNLITSSSRTEALKKLAQIYNVPIQCIDCSEQALLEHRKLIADLADAYQAMSFAIENQDVSDILNGGGTSRDAYMFNTGKSYLDPSINAPFENPGFLEEFTTGLFDVKTTALMMTAYTPLKSLGGISWAQGARESLVGVPYYLVTGKTPTSMLLRWESASTSLAETLFKPFEKINPYITSDVLRSANPIIKDEVIDIGQSFTSRALTASADGLKTVVGGFLPWVEGYAVTSSLAYGAEQFPEDSRARNALNFFTYAMAGDMLPLTKGLQKVAIRSAQKNGQSFNINSIAISESRMINNPNVINRVGVNAIEITLENGLIVGRSNNVIQRADGTFVEVFHFANKNVADEFLSGATLIDSKNRIYATPDGQMILSTYPGSEKIYYGGIPDEVLGLNTLISDGVPTSGKEVVVYRGPESLVAKEVIRNSPDYIEVSSDVYTKSTNGVETSIYLPEKSIDLDVRDLGGNVPIAVVPYSEIRLKGLETINNIANKNPESISLQKVNNVDSKKTNPCSLSLSPETEDVSLSPNPCSLTTSVSESKKIVSNYLSKLDNLQSSLPLDSGAKVAVIELNSRFEGGSYGSVLTRDSGRFLPTYIVSDNERTSFINSNSIFSGDRPFIEMNGFENIYWTSQGPVAVVNSQELSSQIVPGLKNLDTLDTLTQRKDIQSKIKSAAEIKNNGAIRSLPETILFVASDRALNTPSQGLDSNGIKRLNSDKVTIIQRSLETLESSVISRDLTFARNDINRINLDIIEPIVQDLSVQYSDPNLRANLEGSISDKPLIIGLLASKQSGFPLMFFERDLIDFLVEKGISINSLSYEQLNGFLDYMSGNGFAEQYYSENSNKNRVGTIYVDGERVRVSISREKYSQFKEAFNDLSKTKYSVNELEVANQYDVSVDTVRDIACGGSACDSSKLSLDIGNGLKYALSSSSSKKKFKQFEDRNDLLRKALIEQVDKLRKQGTDAKTLNELFPDYGTLKLLERKSINQFDEGDWINAITIDLTLMTTRPTDKDFFSKGNTYFREDVTKAISEYKSANNLLPNQILSKQQYLEILAKLKIEKALSIYGLSANDIPDITKKMSSVFNMKSEETALVTLLNSLTNFAGVSNSNKEIHIANSDFILLVLQTGLSPSEVNDAIRAYMKTTGKSSTKSLQTQDYLFIYNYLLKQSESTLTRTAYQDPSFTSTCILNCPKVENPTVLNSVQTKDGITISLDNGASNTRNLNTMPINSPEMRRIINLGDTISADDEVALLNGETVVGSSPIKKFSYNSGKGVKIENIRTLEDLSSREFFSVEELDIAAGQVANNILGNDLSGGLTNTQRVFRPFVAGIESVNGKMVIFVRSSASIGQKVSVSEVQVLAELSNVFKSLDSGNGRLLIGDSQLPVSDLKEVYLGLDYTGKLTVLDSKNYGMSGHDLIRISDLEKLAGIISASKTIPNSPQIFAGKINLNSVNSFSQLGVSESGIITKSNSVESRETGNIIDSYIAGIKNNPEFISQSKANWIAKLKDLQMLREAEKRAGSKFNLDNILLGDSNELQRLSVASQTPLKLTSVEPVKITIDPSSSDFSIGSYASDVLKSNNKVSEVSVPDGKIPSKNARGDTLTITLAKKSLLNPIEIPIELTIDPSSTVKDSKGNSISACFVADVPSGNNLFSDIKSFIDSIFKNKNSQDVSLSPSDSFPSENELDYALEDMIDYSNQLKIDDLISQTDRIKTFEDYKIKKFIEEETYSGSGDYYLGYAGEKGVNLNKYISGDLEAINQFREYFGEYLINETVNNTNINNTQTSNGFILVCNDNECKTLSTSRVISGNNLQLGFRDNTANNQGIEFGYLSSNDDESISLGFSQDSISNALTKDDKILSVRGFASSPVEDPSDFINAALYPESYRIPTAPSSLSSSVVSDKINLNWVDNSNNEYGFKIYRANETSGYNLISTTAVNATSFIDNTGTTIDQIYNYYVSAYNFGGESSSNVVSEVAGSPPNEPTNFAKTSSSNTQISMSWTDNSNNEAGFKIYRATTNQYDLSSYSVIATIGANSISYTDTSVTSGQTYYYIVSAYIGQNIKSYSTILSANAVTLPSAPTNLVKTGTTNTQISMSWTDNSNNEVGFKIYRATTNPGDIASYTQVGTTGTNVATYTDTGLVTGTTYYYIVSAYITGGYESGYSSILTARAVTLPAAPTGLTGTFASTSQVTLSWTYGANPTGGFAIYYAASGYVPTLVTLVAANQRSATINVGGLTNAYYYYVVASDSNGEYSLESNHVNRGPPPNPGLSFTNNLDYSYCGTYSGYKAVWSWGDSFATAKSSADRYVMRCTPDSQLDYCSTDTFTSTQNSKIYCHGISTSAFWRTHCIHAENVFGSSGENCVHIFI